jgi:hypothetical protein
MKAKEKAKELVDRFYRYTYNAAVEPYSSEDAKKCALIAVDEIMELARKIDDICGTSKDEDYWQEVKQEIESYESE